MIRLKSPRRQVKRTKIRSPDVVADHGLGKENVNVKGKATLHFAFISLIRIFFVNRERDRERERERERER